MKYRTYDRSWNRTGYADEPQYSGQAGLTADYPAKCHCGAAMSGCGDAAWLSLRGVFGSPAWVGEADGYVAWCGNGHEMRAEALA